MGPTTADQSQGAVAVTATTSTSFECRQQGQSISAGASEKPTCGCCSHSKGPTEKPDGWKVLLGAMEQSDQKTLDRWKAEMDNLLIFAGLLSAVVTAFTVESYQWLRDDPAATSVILLAQISDKMTSFSVAAGFINSTEPNPRPIDTSSFAVPDAVRINMLWVLSLTFSLIAAFLALAVQQWLRHIPLPEDMTIRQSTRLRQFRQEGLGHWRVPMIVSFLPILVQVAVILFLIGLLYLLRPLNHDIGLAFTVVAGSLLGSFAITAFLPFYYRDCPYKSSFFPTILCIVQPIAKTILYLGLFVIYIVATVSVFGICLALGFAIIDIGLAVCLVGLALFPVVFTFSVVIPALYNCTSRCLRTVSSPIARCLHPILHRVKEGFRVSPMVSFIHDALSSLLTFIHKGLSGLKALLHRVLPFGRSKGDNQSLWSIALRLWERFEEARKNKQEMVNNKFGDPEKLWLNLELKKMMSDSDIWNSLDESVLASAPMAVARSESSFNTVKECLKDLELASHRALCAFKWAAHHLGVVSGSISDEMCDYSRFSGINPRLLRKVDKIFAERYRETLWEVLPIDGHEFFDEGRRYILLGIMILLMETTKFRHDEPDYPKFVQGYMDLLMKILQAQIGRSLTSDNVRHYGRLPTALIYEGCIRHKHNFRDGDVEHAVNWAHQQLTAGYEECTLSILELTFGSSAIALIAIAQSQDERFVVHSCQQLVPALKTYLESNKQKIQYKAKECALRDGLQVRLVFQHAMSSIYDSLSTLSQSHLYTDTRKKDPQNDVDLDGDAEAIRSTLKEMLQEQQFFNDVLWEVEFPEGVPVPRQRTATPPTTTLEKKPDEAPDAGSEEKLPSADEDDPDSKKADDFGIATLDR
ncbi:hypothetical protein EW026_g1796 [Hermanssonia centrifuga]|uniref:DUF6535 domain-containing protein n=1 Tax=Hermanssonia centrifuga TaxID=98765 RepID=A0A4S4KUU5_9APHY|nr:hypothetical protein EW026_g1796 [Hermanssonia centrifuga]